MVRAPVPGRFSERDATGGLCPPLPSVLCTHNTPLVLPQIPGASGRRVHHAPPACCLPKPTATPEIPKELAILAAAHEIARALPQQCISASLAGMRRSWRGTVLAMICAGGTAEGCTISAPSRCRSTDACRRDPAFPMVLLGLGSGVAPTGSGYGDSPLSSPDSSLPIFGSDAVNGPKNR